MTHRIGSSPGAALEPAPVLRNSLDYINGQDMSFCWEINREKKGGIVNDIGPSTQQVLLPLNCCYNRAWIIHVCVWENEGNVVHIGVVQLVPSVCSRNRALARARSKI